MYKVFRSGVIPGKYSSCSLLPKSCLQFQNGHDEHSTEIKWKVRDFSVSSTVQNYYDDLGLTPKATRAQVKAAYYRLSKKYHPDVNSDPGAKVKFARISEAYEILGNVQKRRMYDGAPRAGSGLHTATRASRGGTTTTYSAEYREFARRAGGFKAREEAPMGGKTTHFDFDAFYREHYGTVLKERKRSKQVEEQTQRRQEETAKHFKNMLKLYFSVMTFFLVVRLFDRNFKRQESTQETGSNLRRK